MAAQPGTPVAGLLRPGDLGAGDKRAPVTSPLRAVPEDAPAAAEARGPAAGEPSEQRGSGTPASRVPQGEAFPVSVDVGERAPQISGLPRLNRRWIMLISRLRGHLVCDKEGPPLIPDHTLQEAAGLTEMLQKCCAVRQT
eukprot:10256554-Alexandrium_andersonii.AAC.1